MLTIFPLLAKTGERWRTYIRKFAGQVEREFNLP
jgi:hypothetical protein